MDLSCIVDSVLSDGNLSVVDDVDFAFDLWYKNKDTKYLKAHKPTFFGSAIESDIDIYHHCVSLFADSHYFLSYYEAISFRERTLNHEKKQKDKDEDERIRRLFKCRYDKRLC